MSNLNIYLEKVKGETQYVKFIDNKWRVISAKTGKLWPQTYDSEQSAKDALGAYHIAKGK